MLSAVIRDEQTPVTVTHWISDAEGRALSARGMVLLAVRLMTRGERLPHGLAAERCNACLCVRLMDPETATVDQDIAPMGHDAKVASCGVGTVFVCLTRSGRADWAFAMGGQESPEDDAIAAVTVSSGHGPQRMTTGVAVSFRGDVANFVRQLERLPSSETPAPVRLPGGPEAGAASTASSAGVYMSAVASDLTEDSPHRRGVTTSRGSSVPRAHDVRASLASSGSRGMAVPPSPRGTQRPGSAAFPSPFAGRGVIFGLGGSEDLGPLVLDTSHTSEGWQAEGHGSVFAFQTRGGQSVPLQAKPGDLRPVRPGRGGIAAAIRAAALSMVSEGNARQRGVLAVV